MSLRKQYNPAFKAKLALEALKGERTGAELASQHGVPGIFKPDQGSPFTWWAWTPRLRVSRRGHPDGRQGVRFLDNIFIERPRRSLKYQCIYLHAFSAGRDARPGIGRWIGF